eukprot:TRINITY_DN27751_c0_g1_i3.p1 TRINITY_DN27751_c0_g1~~TRINITY_DN27751_c0_g1_i3.p1  ORF type:complete len:489 (+),score=59.02 TRINITY_DN27751_c0_g1_i3:174-1469(+)
MCADCAGHCVTAHPEAVTECALGRTGPMLLPRRTLFWLGVNLGTNFLLPHSVSVIAGGYQLVQYDDVTAGGATEQHTVLAADNRIQYQQGNGVFLMFTLLIIAAVAPMVAVFWRIWRLARCGRLGCAHTFLAYGVFYGAYRRQLYLWGLVPLALKVVAATAATILSTPEQKAVFGIMLHSAQLLVEYILQPEQSPHLPRVTSATVLATVAGGQWLLAGPSLAEAVLLRVAITAVNLWCFWALFRAMRAAAPPVAPARCVAAVSTAARAAAGGPRRATGAAARAATLVQEPVPTSPLRRLLCGLPSEGASGACAELQCQAGVLRHSRRCQRALRGAAAALQRGANRGTARPVLADAAPRPVSHDLPLGEAAVSPRSEVRPTAWGVQVGGPALGRLLQSPQAPLRPPVRRSRHTSAPPNPGATRAAGADIGAA